MFGRLPESYFTRELSSAARVAILELVPPARGAMLTHLDAPGSRVAETDADWSDGVRDNSPLIVKLVTVRDESLGLSGVVSRALIVWEWAPGNRYSVVGAVAQENWDALRKKMRSIAPRIRALFPDDSNDQVGKGKDEVME